LLVFAEESGEAIVSADAQAGECRGIDERFGQRLKRSGVSDAAVRPVVVVVAFVLAQGMEQLRMIPDQCPVEQFMAA
jgi:hypothetical protein